MHTESQDIALVPAKKRGRPGFNILAGGKMGWGGFTITAPLNTVRARGGPNAACRT